MTSLNVLVTAASRRVALVRAFRRALRDLGVDGSVVTFDANPHSPALDAADRAYLVPLSSDAGYLDAIERICRQDAIGVVDGRPVVFEINPRFSGGIPLTIAAGVDVPRLLIELALGRSVRPRVGEFLAGLWMSSYETSVFFQKGELMAQDMRADASRLRREIGSDTPPQTVQTRVGSRVAARLVSMAPLRGG